MTSTLDLVVEALRDHLARTVEPVTASIDQFIRNQPEAQIRKWKLCMAWPVEIATDLTQRVVALSPRGLSNDNVDRLMSSLATRYLFDLLANICFMLTTEPESEREKRQLEWLRLRDLIVIGDGSYRMPADHLPKKTSKRLKKAPRAVGSVKFPKFNQELGKEEPIDSISISHQSFIFDDPWGMSMAEKVKAIPAIDREYFLDRWKMYSHIAHASAFSLWPAWMYPIPLHDAIQCLAILLRVVSNYIGHNFDSRTFIDQAWLHTKAAQEAQRG